MSDSVGESLGLPDVGIYGAAVSQSVEEYGYQELRGWFQVGGTSLSAPLIASV